MYICGKNIFLDLYLGDGGTKDIRELAYHGMTIAPLSFLFFGYNVFTQEFFTAVSNAKTATTLSIIENIIFTNLAIFALTIIFGTEGVWHSFWFSEFLTFFFTLYALYKNKDKYDLGKEGIATVFIE